METNLTLLSDPKDEMILQTKRVSLPQKAYRKKERAYESGLY